MPELSIIVPTKNEPSARKSVLELLKAFGNSAEIIIVDKSDARHRKELAGTGALVLSQESDGYENALMEGFRLSKGDIIGTLDPDGTYSISDFGRVVAELRKGKADFVSGNRFAHPSRGAMTPSIAFGNRFLTGLFNILYRKNIHDALSGSFVMTRKAFEAMRDEEPYRAGTMFFEIELARRGYRIIDVPIGYKPRVGSTSRITRAKPIYGLNIASHSIRYARDYNPLVIFGGTGLVLVVIGLVLGLFVIGNYLHTGALTEIGRALIAFMLVVLGFLSIISGLILDLLLQIEKKLYRK
jgi:glycosyltransferase involved in cell wall biosynthesis